VAQAIVKAALFAIRWTMAAAFTYEREPEAQRRARNALPG
jgi:hypothetical protein